jgi:hypothetical protein
MESEAGRIDPGEARRALDEVAADRARMIDRLVPPWWYTVARYAVVGLSVALLPFDRPPLDNSVVILVVGLSVLGLGYERRTGRTLGGRPGTGPLLRWILPGMAIIFALVVLAVVVDHARPDLPFVPALLGLVIFAVGVLFHRQGDIARRARLRARR